MQSLIGKKILRKIDSLNNCSALSGYLLQILELVRAKEIDPSHVEKIWEYFMHRYASVIWEEVNHDFSYLLLRKSDFNRLNVLCSRLEEASKVKLRFPGFIMAEFLAEELGRPFEEVYEELGV